jgi:ADP-Ribosyltransferase in polyvalent proteins
MGQYSDLFNDTPAPPANPGTAVQLTADAVPQQEVKYKDLAARYKVPVDVVRTFPKDYEVKAKVDDIDAATTNAPHLRSWLADTRNTPLVDTKDVGTLGMLEEALKYIVSAPGREGGLAGDVATTALKGAAAVPQAATGLLDIPTGGYAGKALEALGVRFKDANAFLGSMQSTELQAANREVQNASGFFGTIEAALRNPAAIAGTVGESLPLMGAGGVVANGLKTLAPKLAPWLVAALGEGVIGAGSAAEGLREGNADGLLSAKQAFASVMSGAGTALFGALGGKASQKLGIADIDTMLIKGGMDTTTVQATKSGFIASLAKAGVAEGVFEELPQAIQEQMWQNFATDKPIMEGALEAGALGMLAGAAGGIGAQGAHHALTSAAHRVGTEQEQAQRAAESVQRLGKLMALAAQAQLREQSPQTFAELTQAMAENTEGAPTEVRFDARTLGEVLNQDEIAMLPSIRSQLREALDTGGEVTVPIGELMANVAGTPLEQKLTEHMRVGDNALSAFEAKEALAQAETYLQDEAKRVISEATDTVAAQASADRVKANIHSQLTALARFTSDVNGAYATVAANMYTALASRLGVTAEEAYDRYPLKINGVNPATQGEVLNSRPGALSVEGYHYSKAERPIISGHAFGSGLKGSNQDMYANAEDKRLRNRSYFYVDTGTGITPEAGVGGIGHRAQLNNVYDANTDPLRLRKGGQLAFESAVLDNGFDGYLDRLSGTQPGQVVVLNGKMVDAEVLGLTGKTKGKVVPPVGTRESIGRDQVVDRVTANNALPSGAPTLARWAELLPAEDYAAMKQAGVFDGDLTKTMYKSELVKAFESKTEDPVYGQRDREGSRAIGSDTPLPGAPKIEGASGPDQRLVDVAETYAASVGIDLRRQSEYVKVDPERAARIAQAYEDMKHAPQDPEVKAAYADLIKQTMAQYKALEAAGYKFTFFDSSTDPYKGNPWNAMRDLRANQTMAVYGTYDGYGTEGVTQGATEDNPMLADTGLQWPDQGGVMHPVLANDLFRAVHDAFGHGFEGAGFRADGEENAWQAHVRLFTGPAVAAITTETRGQNSWLNYGPYGESNRNAKLEDTVFADQKTGLMPAWTWEEGRAGDMPEAVYEQSDPKKIAGLARIEKNLTPAERNKYQSKYLAGRDVASLNPEERAQYDALATPQTDTPEFKAWFGDSKVVDAEGKPLVVYHGTTYTGPDGSGLDQFKENTGWFTAYPSEANTYGGLNGQGANIVPAFLSIKNPRILDQRAATNGSVRDAVEALQGDEDGVLVMEDGKIRWAIVASPNQIKSAIGNNGQFDPNDPNILHAPGARGTFNPKTLTISLLERANLSTFHHEMAHFYLETLIDIASGPNAPAPIVSDVNTLMGWFGVKDLATWNGMSFEAKRASHEKFAEHYERYLFEGQSPNQEMQTLFRRFSTWMKDVYKNVKDWMEGMGKTLTPEVRGVYDRMLATDAQIEEAEHVRNYAPLFKSADQAGMTPEAWTIYQLQAQDATETAMENLQTRSLRDMKLTINAQSRALKALTKDAAEKRKAIEAEVKMEVASLPVYEAKAYLDAAHKPTAEDKAASAAHKALRDAAAAKALEDAKAALPGFAEVKGLEKAQLVAKSKRELANTVDREMIAWDRANPKPEKTNSETDLQVASEMFGYSSPDEMLRAIREAEPFAGVVDGMTDQRMLERYGDLATPEALTNAANAAVHNEARARFVATELKALNEGMRLTPPSRLSILEKLKECLGS